MWHPPIGRSGRGPSCSARRNHARSQIDRFAPGRLSRPPPVLLNRRTNVFHRGPATSSDHSLTLFSGLTLLRHHICRRFSCSSPDGEARSQSSEFLDRNLNRKVAVKNTRCPNINAIPASRDSISSFSSNRASRSILGLSGTTNLTLLLRPKSGPNSSSLPWPNCVPITAIFRSFSPSVNEPSELGPLGPPSNLINSAILQTRSFSNSTSSTSVSRIPYRAMQR
ncbi:zinc finger C-x8-C-x5-C-x3-H type family protein [Striga asiatica]|uniref:Zinc finger C-x8-C-x5-C-x3-H type family protein n=1 Tax=Striga asiatica TaxID=4170 RepID=A0A5A7PSB2_STRAF|nr:zinc finger C-x8-C-x5-C-x3-H type family protein [Striga asiatica]